MIARENLLNSVCTTTEALEDWTSGEAAEVAITGHLPTPSCGHRCAPYPPDQERSEDDDDAEIQWPAP